MQQKLQPYDLNSPPKFSKNLTTAFLYPLAGLNYELSEHPSFHLFLDRNKDDKHSLILRIDNLELFQEWRKSNEEYIEEEWEDEYGLCVRMGLDDLSLTGIDPEKEYIKPFIEGKFSEINKRLINFYPKFVPTGKVTRIGNSSIARQVMGFCLQRKIHQKSNDLRYYWEERIDCNLPEDAEVWSKPNLDEEYYRSSETGTTSSEDQQGGVGSDE